MSDKPRCRHCNRDKVSRPRGLCWTCYYRPGVRDMYPSMSKFAPRNLGDIYREAPLPSAPTDAPVGSEAKVKVLCERAERGESLWHPDDIRAVDPADTSRRVRGSISPSVVREIRKAVAGRERGVFVLIARRYGISVATVSEIGARHTYRHVTDEPTEGEAE